MSVLLADQIPTCGMFLIEYGMRVFMLLIDMCAPAQVALQAPAVGCSVCGTFKKSGKVSCCAHNGSWFGRCGGADDPRFDHTWMDGTRVCDVSARESSSESVLNAAFAQSPNVTHSETTGERWHVTGSQTTTSSSTHAVTAARDVGQMRDVTRVANVIQAQDGSGSQDVSVSNQVDQGEQTIDWETSGSSGFGTRDSKGSVKVVVQLVVCVCSMFVLYFV